MAQPNNVHDDININCESQECEVKEKINLHSNVLLKAKNPITPSEIQNGKSYHVMDSCQDTQRICLETNIPNTIKTVAKIIELATSSTLLIVGKRSDQKKITKTERVGITDQIPDPYDFTFEESLITNNEYCIDLLHEQNSSCEDENKITVNFFEGSSSKGNDSWKTGFSEIFSADKNNDSHSDLRRSEAFSDCNSRNQKPKRDNELNVDQIKQSAYFSEDESSIMTDSDNSEDDEDFTLENYTDNDSSSSETNYSESEFENIASREKNSDTKHISNTANEFPKSIAENLKMQKRNRTKLIKCKYCDLEMHSKNFVRQVERHHKSESDVLNLMSYPKSSKERRQAFSAFRNDMNFDIYVQGTTHPKRYKKSKTGNVDCIPPSEYYPCIYCKGIFLKTYLSRHVKQCQGGNKAPNNYCLAESQTFAACHLDQTNTISRLEVKEKVFNMMKADVIAFEAKKDLLIVHYGESYLKKHNSERSIYVCSNNMRELSRLLITYRMLYKETCQCKDLLLPKNFDKVVGAVRKMSGYDPQKKTFAVPSLALHFGTNLKHLCDELDHLLLKEANGFKCQTTEDKKEWRYQIKSFKKLIESRWNIEMSSLANKDLEEKKWKKPLLLPLVSDIKKFREESFEIGRRAVEKLKSDPLDTKSYKDLVQCTLALLILFNRRRIGDVQFLKIDDYENDQRSSYKDFENAISDTEKVLANKYKRVLNRGKGSRQVVILVPPILEHFIKILLSVRKNFIEISNDYLFAVPGSKIKWGRGDIAIRNLTKYMSLQNPALITSNKLRKQIATVMQILNLSKDEAKQFAKFMGHTEKTHDEFYELPVDIYQTAKVSKLLLMIEKGVPVEHKGKSLAQIDIDTQFAMEYDDPAEKDVPGDQNEKHGEDRCSEDKRPCIADKKFNGKEQRKACYLSDTVNPLKSEQNMRISDSDEIIGNSNNRIIEKLSDDEEITTEVTESLKRSGRKRWSEIEIGLLRKSFGSLLKHKKYPRKEDIIHFCTKHKIDRDPSAVKSKLQHLMLKNYH